MIDREIGGREWKCAVLKQLSALGEGNYSAVLVYVTSSRISFAGFHVYFSIKIVAWLPMLCTI